MLKLYNIIQGEVESAKPEKQTIDRADEYYWLIGEFALNKGVLKIQRDGLKEKMDFKEAITLTLEGINSKFMKRYNGMDLNAGIGNLALTTYSSFGRNKKIENTIISQNYLAKSEGDLCLVNIRIIPPHTDTQLEIEARAKSLRVYYIPFLMSRVMIFLGQEEVRSSTYNALSEIKDNTQDTIQAALEGKKSKILIYIESPILIVPIMRNNDPASPIWCFKLGDIKINSKVLQ